MFASPSSIPVPPDAALFIPEELSGRIFIRDDNNKLVAELHKYVGIPITLALDQGTYNITLTTEDKSFSATIELIKGDKIGISSKDLTRERLARNRARGDIPEELEPLEPGIPESFPWDVSPIDSIKKEEDPPVEKEPPTTVQPAVEEYPKVIASIAFVPGVAFPATGNSIVSMQAGILLAQA
jgi:hypothetical protein